MRTLALSLLGWWRAVMARFGLSPSWATAVGACVLALVLWLLRGRYTRWRNRRRARALTTSPRVSKPLRFTIVTVGTRGDCQPFVALARGLQAKGHSVVICTCDQFKGLVTANGVTFASCGVERVEQGAEWLSASTMAEFVKASAAAFDKDTDSMARTVFATCQGKVAGVPKPDALIVNLFAMQMGMDVAEALSVPCWVAKLCPDAPSRHTAPFGEQRSRFGWMNLARHYLRLLGQIKAAGEAKLTEHQNKYRKEVMGLGPIGLQRLSDMSHVPTLLGYSPRLLPKPADWSDWLMPSGFWFLDAQSQYQPPQHLQEFLQNGPKPVCVTFGSMHVVGSTNIVSNAIKAVTEHHRCVLITGSAEPPPELPDTVCVIKSVPHDWLFPRCKAVVFHGGAGTFARVVHAGIPSVIVPILRFFDQPGWGETAEDQRIGALVRKAPTVDALRAALVRAGGPVAVPMANKVGAALRLEDGVALCVEQLEACLCARVKATPSAVSAPVVAMCKRNCLACQCHDSS